MINDSYRQKVAEHYYNLGREYAIKEAYPQANATASSSIPKPRMPRALKEGVRDGVSSLTNTNNSDQQSTVSDKVKAKLLEAAKGYAKSTARHYMDPSIPKNESLYEGAANTLNDVYSVVTNPLLSPAAMARTAQRYGKAIQANDRTRQEMFNRGGIYRNAAENYIQAHPKFDL